MEDKEKDQIAEQEEQEEVLPTEEQDYPWGNRIAPSP